MRERIQRGADGLRTWQVKGELAARRRCACSCAPAPPPRISRSGSRTPKNVVHSAPEYVVGTETSGKPLAAEAAFAVSIALPPPTATIVSTPSGTRIRCEGTSSHRSGSVENVTPAWAGDDERPIARELRQFGEAPADDHFASSARANSTNASAARVAVRPAARTREISRFASSPSTFADVSVPAASSDSTAEREMNATP